MLNNYYLKVFVFLFGFLTGSCCVKSTESNKIVDRRLVIYPVLNDLNIIIKSDTNWSEPYTCLNLKIDTIDLRQIKKIDNQYFKYNGVMLSYKSLYYLNQMDDLKQFKIESFEVSYVGLENPRVNEGNCLNNSSLRMIKDLYKVCKNNSVPKAKVFFSEVKVQTKSGSIDVLDGIICTLNILP